MVCLMDERQMTEACTRQLTVLGGLADREKRVRSDMKETVVYARRSGATWRMVGVALGVSTQAAWERFREPEPKRPIPGQGHLFSDPSNEFGLNPGSGHRPGFGQHMTTEEYEVCPTCTDPKC